MMCTRVRGVFNDVHPSSRCAADPDAGGHEKQCVGSWTYSSQGVSGLSSVPDCALITLVIHRCVRGGHRRWGTRETVRRIVDLHVSRNSWRFICAY